MSFDFFFQLYDRVDAQFFFQKFRRLVSMTHEPCQIMQMNNVCSLKTFLYRTEMLRTTAHLAYDDDY